MMVTANSLSSPFNVITTLTNSNALLSKKPFMLVSYNSKNQLNALHELSSLALNQGVLKHL
ncbi:hypothetical protein AOR11_15855 [Vibrio alginolyticus]|nr:hypothetical protein [Vibrio alginolyticus]KPN01667.1 hypothetical protein AOR11_15855 [Vibrio alginolyticus]